MKEQTEIKIAEPVDSVETYEFEPIQGEPVLRWKGKRPFESTQFFPAQLKETHGDEVDGWRNKIYWGDNLQVMSHLLKTYRGKINLIYIDPPFDSKADYKKAIKLRGKQVENDRTAFEEKQYSDIWTNDDYLQFMYKRLILMRELLADNGSIYVHCDWRVNSFIRLVLDEIFGKNFFKAEIIWKQTRAKSTGFNNYGLEHNSIFFFTKSENHSWNIQYKDYEQDKVDRYYRYFELDDGTYTKYTKKEMREFRESGSTPEGRRFALIPLLNMNKDRPNLRYEYKGFVETWATRKEKMLEYERNGLIVQESPGAMPLKKQYFDEMMGIKVGTLWDDINPVNSQAKEKVNYPTQKPEDLLERIIKASSNPGDLVFDCFMGSGTTQAVAMKLGRRFIGADINLGAVETTSKRILNVASEIQENMAQQKIDIQDEETENPQTFYTGFETCNVNRYDVFRNPVEAKELLIEALEIQPLPTAGIYDGEKDGRKVIIMPVDRIATRADLNELKANFQYHTFEKRQEENLNAPVEKLLLVCMGHEPDLRAELQKDVPYELDIEITDILRDKSELEFKREADAKIVRNNGQLIIEQFYPMNLLQKLSLRKENVEDWRELVESVKIDFNFDNNAMKPSVVDLPEENKLVKGAYPIPEDAGTIRVKITDLLSESLEETLE